ncbi:unnamed protein product [Ectocarpus sp. CCAP 1310/34]|nr:unnamed protein product [Ectocarpus sp. CCAP 1310/34]
MLSRPSPLPFASASATTAKSKSGLTIGSTVPVERAASPDGGKRSRDSSSASGSDGGDCGDGGGNGSTEANPWSGDVMRSARGSCDGDSSRRPGEEQEQQLQPPSFPDMVVEALHALSDSRGSSKLATVKWLKSSSRYGWMAAPPDEAKFKANVAAGVKQVGRWFGGIVYCDGGGDGGGAPSHGVKETVTEEEGTGELAWAAGEEPKPNAIKRPTGRSKGRTPKTIDGGGFSNSGGGGGGPKGSRVSRSQALDLVEDGVLHAREQEAQTGDGATAEPPLRPPRPTPVNRLRVPAGAVGDLLTVWDFLKELHLKEPSVLTLEEFETAVLWSSNNTFESKKSVHPLIAEFHLDMQAPVRRILGDLLNPATWPEVLRRFAMAYLRYSRALFSRHGRGRGEGVDEGHPLATAVETLSRRGCGDLSSSETLCVLRWLSDVLMDSRSVRAKIAQHAELQSRVTARDRKKAEERDHLVAESLSLSLAHRGRGE